MQIAAHALDGRETNAFEDLEHVGSPAARRRGAGDARRFDIAKRLDEPTDVGHLLAGRRLTTGRSPTKAGSAESESSAGAGETAQNSPHDLQIIGRDQAFLLDAENAERAGWCSRLGMAYEVTGACPPLDLADLGLIQRGQIRVDLIQQGGRFLGGPSRRRSGPVPLRSCWAGRLPGPPRPRARLGQVVPGDAQLLVRLIPFAVLALGNP